MNPSLAALALGAALVAAPPAAPDDADRATLAAMQSELARAAALRLESRPAPYFVSYWVVDASQHDTQGTLGALVASNHSASRRVRAEVRVGSPALDNSNFLGASGDGFQQMPGGALVQVPMSDADALRHGLWLATDGAYKDAVEALEQKRAAREGEMGDGDVPSYSIAPATTLMDARDAPVAASPANEEFVRRVSAVFRRHPEVQRSWVHLVVSIERRYFVSTEGSTAVFDTPYSEVEIFGETQAPDGMSLSRTVRLPVVAASPPPEAEAVAAAEGIARDLVALRSAPLLEDYAGPVLFEGMAAAQIAHDLLAEALSGSPAPKGAEGLESPLSRKLGKRILPRTFDVYDDPTLTTFGGHPLVGHYPADDEGVVPGRVALVEDGRLRGFLMSRMPRKDVPASNGHGRSGLSGWARGRAGNLIVEARGGLSRVALRRRLLEAAREEGLDEALVITALEPRAGASSGQGVAPPELAYRVKRDGTEELVRVAEIGAIALRDLRDIIATGREGGAYHYAMPTGAGFALPSTVVAPDLLFEDVEVRRPSAPHRRPPLLPPPPIPQGSLQQRTPVE